MELKKSLPPQIYDDTKVLILGSMPGEESLRRQQYYGYPHNAFWRLVAAAIGTKVPDEYGARLDMLKNHGIGLWDVIGTCLREGSLDTSIKDEEPNPVDSLLEENRSIKAVFFNGGKAASSFKKSFGYGILERNDIFYSVLPSSSPANTAGFESKFETWKIIADFLEK